jgi:hypothetical protein
MLNPPNPGEVLTGQMVDKHGGQIVDGTVTIGLPQLQALLGELSLFVIKTCANAEKERERDMKIDVDTLGTPPDEMLREWVTKAGGQMDGDTAIMKLPEVKAMVLTLTKVIGRAVGQAVVAAREEEDDKPTENSPAEFNSHMVIQLASMTEGLTEMRNELRQGENDWSKHLYEIDSALAGIRRLAILACGRDE